MALKAGSAAPTIERVDFSQGPTVLFFYKVTCPTCQMSAPKMQVFEDAYPGRIVGVGQNPKDKLAEFSHAYGWSFRSVPDLAPYPVSNGYDVHWVPTTFLVSPDARVIDAVEAWDREGLNRLSKTFAGLAGAEYVAISTPDDGLPPFRPG